MRTRIMNQLQALAMNEGQRRKKKLWSATGRAQLEKLALGTWASRRRKDLLELLDRMNPTIEELTAAVEREARKWPEVLRLMTRQFKAIASFPLSTANPWLQRFTLFISGSRSASVCRASSRQLGFCGCASGQEELLFFFRPFLLQAAHC
jgi:hypothetical protein